MVSIRRAKPQDIDFIFNLGTTASEFSVNKKTVNFWPKGILSQAVTSKGVVILVAEVDHKVVGFIVANLNTNLRKAVIENIYVAPGNRGNGIGDKLLAELLDALDDASIEYVSTLIPTDTPIAARLYEAAGFTKGETFLWLDKSITNTFRSD